MLEIRENLTSEEAAKAYNQRIYNFRQEAREKSHHPGCISALACEYCYHVISDCVCLCAGTFVCPNCNKINGKPTTYIPANNPLNITQYIYLTGVPESTLSSQNWSGMNI